MIFKRFFAIYYFYVPSTWKQTLLLLGVLLLLLISLVLLAALLVLIHGLILGVPLHVGDELLRVSDVLLCGIDGVFSISWFLLFIPNDKEDDLFRDFGGKGGAGSGTVS